MKYRNLGKNGPRISEVGLGCWQFGNDWGTGITEEKAMEIMETAVAQGMDLFDTADVYGNGRSETLIGAFLKRCEKPITVITKYGRGQGVYPDGYSEKSLRISVEGSLKRLGVAALDLLQLHCIPTEVLEKGQIFSWLRKMQEEGLIRAFGASIESMEQGLLCMEQEGLISLQVIFNLFRQRLLKELFPKAIASGTGIIVRLPLASGLLTGKFTQDTTFPETDHRTYNRDGQAFNVGETFAGLPFVKGVSLANAIRTRFLPKELGMVELALRWILDHDAVSCIIPGASAPNQVIANAGASTLPPLPLALHEELYRFYMDKVHHHVRGAY